MEIHPSQNYGVSLAIWDHTILPATRHERTHHDLTPASEGGEMEGWVYYSLTIFYIIEHIDSSMNIVH